MNEPTQPTSEHPSRRSLLGMSSVALAAAAFAGLTANAQTKRCRRGDLWIFPAGFPHSIQGLDPDGTEFLLVFNQGSFSEDGTMLVSEW